MVHLGPLQGGEHVVFVGGHKLVGGRHHVACVVEREVVHGELSWKVGFLVERVGHFAHAFPLLVFEAVGHVAFEEEVLVEVCRGLCADTHAETIHEVLREHGVDGANVHLGGVFGVDARFDEVFNEGFGNPEYRFEPFYLLEFVDERVHRTFALAELFAAVLFPKFLVAHVGVGFGERFALEAEGFVGDGREGKVGVLGGALHLEFLNEAGELELHEHVVAREHLFAGGERVELLDYAHVFHKVDVGAYGNAHVHFAYAVGAVGHDVEAAGESEVLRIVGREVYLYAAVGVVHEERVDNEVAVEADGGTGGDGAGEGVLQQTHLVFVDVDVGEAVLEHGGHDVARVEQLVDAVGLLAYNDVLLRAWVFAVNLPHDGFVDGDGEDEFSGFVTHLNVVLEEGEVLELAVFEDLFGHFVEGEGELGVFVYAEVVVRVEVASFLGGNDVAHEFDGGIVLARIFRFVSHHGG